MNRFFRTVHLTQKRPWTASTLVKWIIGINIGIFILQGIFKAWFRSSLIEDLLGLTHQGVQAGFYWTLFTYAFIHGGLLHLVLNSLVLFFIGSSIAEETSPWQFFLLYGLSVFLGGLAWMFLNWNWHSLLIGSSAGTMGLLFFFCCLYPHRPVTILIFFIIPLTLKPKWLAWGLFIYDLLNYLTVEVYGRSSIASSAHLGGMLGGVACYLLFQHTKHKQNPSEKPKKAVPEAPFTVNIQEIHYTKEELNHILEKVSKLGFGCLSEKEKRVLNQAKKDQAL